jgi:hypothetical protein
MATPVSPGFGLTLRTGSGNSSAREAKEILQGSAPWFSSDQSENGPLGAGPATILRHGHQ